MNIKEAKQIIYDVVYEHGNPKAVIHPDATVKEALLTIANASGQLDYRNGIKQLARFRKTQTSDSEREEARQSLLKFYYVLTSE